MSNIQDPESRGTMIFAWWMTCISDAYASAYYRRKPVLDDDDYDIDFYTVDPVDPDMVDAQGPSPSPREQLEVGNFPVTEIRNSTYLSIIFSMTQFLVSQRLLPKIDVKP
jgi:hypothetical protein